MTALERPLTERFPKILELPSGLKLEASLMPPGPVTEMDEERGVAALPGKRLAVCLHPWARLGGNMDDPCVRFIRLSHEGLSLNDNDNRRSPSLLLRGDEIKKIVYSGHSCARSHIISNSTYCAIMRAASGSRRVGNRSRGYKRPRTYVSS